MTFTLRDYQQQAIEAVDRQFERGYKAPLVSIFTGGGKTEIFSVYTSRRDLKKERVLIMAPAHLIYQTAQRMRSRVPELRGEVRVNGVRMVRALGVVMGTYNEPEARVVVGSVPTLIDRVPEDMDPITREDFILNDYGGVELAPESSRNSLVSQRFDEVLKYGLLGYVIYDEAHHAVADGSLLILKRLAEIHQALGIPPVRIIGFTATPQRADERALGNIFDCIAFQRSFDWGIKHGYLTPLRDPIRVHVDTPDGRKKVLKTEDWADAIVTAWEERGEGRPTLAYLASVEASRELAEAFRKRGHAFAHVDAEIVIGPDGQEYDKDYRETLLQGVFDGSVKGICNYGVFLEGTDVPPASCLIWARPTDNIVLTTQAIGRVLRLFDGNDYLPPKKDALIIDVTSSDIEVMTAGTLAGFTYDPTTDKYIADEEDEEETTEIIEGLDMRDTRPGKVEIGGVVYSVGRLIKKSGSDWYLDEDTGVLSLGVSENDTLLILPPYYTLAVHLQMELEKLGAKLNDNPLDPSLQRDYAVVEQAEELFGSYTLWHVADRRIPDLWVRSQRDSLDLLMDFAVPYAQEVSDPVTSFIKRGARWKRQPMTQPQRKMLTGLLGRGGFDPDLTCGEASQLITHTIAFRLLGKRLVEIYKQLGPYAFIPKVKVA